MRIVVIGGSGQIGRKVVQNLRWEGHEAVPASPSTGVNTLTGAGLAEAMTGANIVVDVSNSPSFADEAVMDFFDKSTQNIAQAAKAAGSVNHYVALSVVGTDLVPDSGYFRAKLRQESLIKESGIPYTIVRATQFFEFLGAIASVATDRTSNNVRVGPVFLQPIAAGDVGESVVRASLSAPANAIIDIAGPKRYRLDELMRLHLAALQDPREVILDPDAGYFGTKVSEQALVPQSGQVWLGSQCLEEWLGAPTPTLAQN
jgi:uncharacterized protein YbjT (DUF2867 family)